MVLDYHNRVPVNYNNLLQIILRGGVHIHEVEIPYYREIINDNNNCDLRISYIRKKIDQKHMKQTLGRRYLKICKSSDSSSYF